MINSGNNLQIDRCDDCGQILYDQICRNCGLLHEDILLINNDELFFNGNISDRSSINFLIEQIGVTITKTPEIPKLSCISLCSVKRYNSIKLDLIYIIINHYEFTPSITNRMIYLIKKLKSNLYFTRKAGICAYLAAREAGKHIFIDHHIKFCESLYISMNFSMISRAKTELGIKFSDDILPTIIRNYLNVFNSDKDFKDFLLQNLRMDPPKFTLIVKRYLNQIYNKTRRSHKNYRPQNVAGALIYAATVAASRDGFWKSRMFTQRQLERLFKLRYESIRYCYCQMNKPDRLIKKKEMGHWTLL